MKLVHQHSVIYSTEFELNRLNNFRVDTNERTDRHDLHMVCRVYILYIKTLK